MGVHCGISVVLVILLIYYTFLDMHKSNRSQFFPEIINVN